MRILEPEASAPPWDVPSGLVIDALASSLVAARPDLHDPDAVYQAMRLTGIRPSAIGFYWRDAIEEARRRIAGA